MSDNFNNKDYGEYFSAIEKSLNSGKIPTNETTVKPIHKKKKLRGGIFRLRPWVLITLAAVIIAVIIIILLPKKTKANDNVSSESRLTEMLQVM